ncbi:MAG: aminomethyl-transferring glycine dehydrogenase subunit GcvPB, partial [Dehalococcoidia bacterium]|nr:aminomethyl-transferring glycine dehydrogenase subunit GcvPB [Dehalococcoidia bacterium]
NFGMHVRAYTYLRSLGADGLREVSEHAVLNANYLRVQLAGAYDLPYDRVCMHEVVFSGQRQKREHGVRALDIAKRLIDYGYHPPTIYFPLVVDEALMIEPTETESRETLDGFIDAMRAIAHEAATDPDVLRSAPHTTPVGRLDEALAARRPDLRWRPPTS